MGYEGFLKYFFKFTLQRVHEDPDAVEGRVRAIIPHRQVIEVRHRDPRDLRQVPDGDVIRLQGRSKLGFGW